MGLTSFVVLERKEERCNGEEGKAVDCLGIVQPSSSETSGSG